MPGNISIDKSKCVSSASNNLANGSNSVSKLFYGLLNSKSGFDLASIRNNKKCHQNNSAANNAQLRRSFKLLKAHHRLDSNRISSSDQVTNNLTNESNKNLNDYNDSPLIDYQLPLCRPIIKSCTEDPKMKSNDAITLLTTAQIATVIDEDEDETSRPPTPPVRNTSLLESLRPSSSSSLSKNQISQSMTSNLHLINNSSSSYPNYNRELPRLPISPKRDEKRKSISFGNRVSPISDDGGFNSFDLNFSSQHKRNSISVFNHRNLSNNYYLQNALPSSHQTQLQPQLQSQLQSQQQQHQPQLQPQQQQHNYRNSINNQINYHQHNNVNKYSPLIENPIASTNVFHTSASSGNIVDKWNLTAFDNTANRFHDNSASMYNIACNQRNSYFSDVDPNLDLDYQNINANANFALNNQKCENWSSSTSVLSAYTGIASSSTSGYYTASSETITNSPSLSSLNSAICNSSMNTCNSPPLNKASNFASHHTNSNGVVCGAQSLVNSHKNLSYSRQFSYPDTQHIPSSLAGATTNTKLAKSQLISNTGIAISSLVEKPKRQESASVLYYVVAKDSSSSFSNSCTDEQTKEQEDVDKKNLLTTKGTPFDETLSSSSACSFVSNKHCATTATNNLINHNNSVSNDNYTNLVPCTQPPQLRTTPVLGTNQPADLKAIQKSLHEFYLRHRGGAKDVSMVNCDRSTRQSEQKQFDNNFTNYSLTSNDSACSDSSTISPTESPTLFSNNLMPTIQLPAKPSYLSMIKKLSDEEERRLNELRANAIYSNLPHEEIHDDLEHKDREDQFELTTTSKELRLSFRERCSPFESNNSIKQSSCDKKTRNELIKLNQPNNVKNIAKQFDSLTSTSNCDLNANRVSPISINKLTTDTTALNSSSNSSSSSSCLSDENGLINDDLTKDKSLSTPHGSSDEMTNECMKSASIESNTNQTDGEMSDEVCREKILENEEKIKMFVEFISNKSEITKVDLNKITLHIEEVNKVTKLILSLTSRLNKIESILQLRNNQHQNGLEQNGENQSTNDSQLLDVCKFKQSNSTDSLLDEKNLFSSILSLSSISLNNLNCNGTAFFASIEMLTSKKNKILDQLEEATQLKAMIERRCKNIHDRIISKRFDFTIIDFDSQSNREFKLLKNFSFIDSMTCKHELSLRSFRSANTTLS